MNDTQQRFNMTEQDIQEQALYPGSTFADSRHPPSELESHVFQNIPSKRNDIAMVHVPSHGFVVTCSIVRTSITPSRHEQQTAGP